MQSIWSFASFIFYHGLTCSCGNPIVSVYNGKLLLLQCLFYHIQYQYLYENTCTYTHIYLGTPNTRLELETTYGELEWQRQSSWVCVWEWVDTLERLHSSQQLLEHDRLSGCQDGMDGEKKSQSNNEELSENGNTIACTHTHTHTREL